MLSTLWFYLKTRFMLDEEGQGMVEYGLILALVAVVAVVGLNLLGVKVDELLRGVVDSFTPSTP